MAITTQVNGTTVSLGTLGTLASGAAVAMASYSLANMIDAKVTVTALTATTGVSTTGQLVVYFAGSDSTTFPDNAPSAGGATTVINPTNWITVAFVNANANSFNAQSEPLSVAAAFGGVLPANLIVIVSNQTGAALQSGSVSLTPVTLQTQ